MAEYKPYNFDWFVKNQLVPPESIAHGTEEDVREKLKPAKTWNWKLEGNQLSCETDLGPMTQTIPTDVILTGEDENGLPILQRIVL